jgi:hypothetical protein
MSKSYYNRRNFIKNWLTATASVSAYSLLSSCSSFDDYLFEDRNSFNDEVIIVGGGVSGLYLGYKLRTKATEFRLFEGSNTFGGRIKSNSGIDYGASLIGNDNVLAGELLKYLSIETKAVDKDFVYLVDGMQRLPDSLVERVVGLIPYRNFRLRWKLVAIEKISSGYTLTFENPNGQKKFSCRKIALAIPPTQWTSVDGLLELPEMKWANSWLASLETQNTIKFVLPLSAIGNSSKSLVETSYENLNLRQVVKRGRSSPLVEVDVSYLSKQDFSIDYIYNALKKKLQINHPLQKLSTEQFYDWKQVRLIQGSSFKNFLAIPDPLNANFQVVGDFTASSGIYTLEGALQSAKRAAELFL